MSQRERYIAGTPTSCSGLVESEGLAAADDKRSFPMYRGCCEHVLENDPLEALRFAGQGAVMPAPTRASVARVLDKAIAPAVVVILRTNAMSRARRTSSFHVREREVKCRHMEFHTYAWAFWRKLRFIRLTCSDSTLDLTRPGITHHTTDNTTERYEVFMKGWPEAPPG